MKEGEREAEWVGMGHELEGSKETVKRRGELETWNTQAGYLYQISECRERWRRCKTCKICCCKMRDVARARA